MEIRNYKEEAKVLVRRTVQKQFRLEILLAKLPSLEVFQVFVDLGYLGDF